jgi:hypothetical protein
MKTFHLALLAASSWLLAMPASAQLKATATVTDSQVSPGEYLYDVTLNNTGTTTIGTFWFSWVPGLNFMSATPTNISSPTGWTDHVTTGPGSAIQWLGGSNVLAPGNSLNAFSFMSTETPAQLGGFAPSPNQAYAVTTSFVYSGAPFSDSGYQFTAPVGPAPAVPEPATAWLVLSGLGGLAAVMQKTRSNRARVS